MTAKLTILAIATKQEKILNQVGEEVKKLVNKVHKGIFHKNIEISILTTKKNSKVNTSLGSHRKNQTRKDRTNKNTHTHTHTHQYEQKCQSHTCSGTINSMYDNDLTTTTPALTSSAPYSGWRPVNWVSAAIPEATGRLSHTTGWQQTTTTRTRKKTDWQKGKEKLKERRTWKD